MFTAIVSIAGLIASAYLGRRELTRRKESGESIAGLVASAYLGRRELTRRKESGDRSGMGWGITFCIMQAIAVALGFLGMAPDDILSPIILNAVLTACAWASFARDITWARIESYMRFGDELAARTFRPDCGGCDKYDACAHRITRDEDLSRIGRLGRKLRGRVRLLGPSGAHPSQGIG